MKENKKKKLLIPLIAAACMIHGCSSQTISSPKTQTTAPVNSQNTNAEGAKTEEGSTKEADTKETDPKKADTKETNSDKSKEKEAGNGSNSENSNTSQENRQAQETGETDKKDEKDNKGTDDNSSDETAKKASKENSEETDKEKNDKGKNDKGKNDIGKNDIEETDLEENNEEETDEKENKFIQSVKNAHPESFSACTYGKAFDEFFSSPQWEYFESSNGQNVVEFTGECMYAGAPTKARMQFIVSKNNSAVTAGALYYNNTPQTVKIITESLNQIFEQYAKAHDIAYTPPASAAAQTSQTNALPPENPAAPTQNQNTPNQPAQAGQAQNQTSQAQNQAPTTINSTGAQAALEFAAWTNPTIGSWHSPSTGYYLIPYIDNAGNASLRFVNENTQAAATIYYTDAVSAVTNEVGGLTYQAYLYTPSGETQQLVGMVEVTWNSIAELKSLSVNMIKGSQVMDNSMAGNDYTYYGAVN